MSNINHTEQLGEAVLAVARKAYSECQKALFVESMQALTKITSEVAVHTPIICELEQAIARARVAYAKRTDWAVAA